MRRFARTLALGLALALAGCGGGDDASQAARGEEDAAARRGSDAPSSADPAAVSYAEELGVELESMEESVTGLRYRTLEEGTGTAADDGDSVSVHYTGWLPGGRKFDSSRDRGEPFSFVVGGGQVIPGWDEGVDGMAVGEVRQLVVPPDLAYGDRQVGPIPPNSVLVFEVELLEIH